MVSPGKTFFELDPVNLHEVRRVMLWVFHGGQGKIPPTCALAST